MHYSGKVVQNSGLHLGVFYAGQLEGAMQFGPPLDKRKMLGLVEGTQWHQMIELNRMGFSEALPRNSESRALGVAFRMFKKHKPDLKWIVSFADGIQCGDGAIYRASGFLLTKIKVNKDLLRLPGGRIVHSMTLKSSPNAIIPEVGQSFSQISRGSSSLVRFIKATNAEVLSGVHLRYVKFLDSTWLARLTVPVIPFEHIPDECRMYRGDKIMREPIEGAVSPTAAGGASPTLALHLGDDDFPREIGTEAQTNPE